MNQLYMCTVCVTVDQTRDAFYIELVSNILHKKYCHELRYALMVCYIYQIITMFELYFGPNSTYICDPRRTINFVHCTILVPLSLGSSSQNQRQQRSGDRLRHWIPKVLSHVTRKLPIFTYQAVDLFFANIMLRPRICVPFKIFIVR